MSEQEMLQEIERLRRELAEVREDRDCLHKMVCKMLPFEEIQLTENDLKEMRETAVTFEELLAVSSPKISPATNSVNPSVKGEVSINS